MRMRYVLYAAAAALACALPGATAASVTRPSRPVLTPCAGPLAGLGGRCASIGVALDRVHPAAGRTRIVFALLLRRDKSRPSLGTVVLSSGPIIAAGVEYAQGLAPLRARRDLLFIDQRGTGRSGAVSCRGFDGVVPALGPREQLLERIGACGRQLGSRAGFYGSAAAADDIDAVRAALGFERLDLWGASYGTYVMTIYAARHPTHVRSLVLHGAYPID